MRAIFVCCLLAVPPSAEQKADHKNNVIKVDSVVLAPMRSIEIPARESGVLARVNGTEGRMVSVGESIALVDDGDAVLETKEAETALKIAQIESQSTVSVELAKASHAYAKLELERVLQAVGKAADAVSESEIDQLRLSVRKAILTVKQAEDDAKSSALKAESANNRLQRTQQKVERHRIVAPISGIVAEQHFEQGEWVEAGQVVSRLLQVDRLKVEGVLNADLLVKKLTGADVTVTTNLPGKSTPTKFKGRLVFVSSETNAFNNTVRFRAEIDNRDLLLRPGMKGSIAIHLTPSQTAGVQRRRSIQ